MSRGSPDFQGIRSFPLYGPYTESITEPVKTTIGPSDIVTITGKGFIFGGSIFCSTNDTLIADNIKLTIDDTAMSQRTWEQLYLRSWHKQPSLPMSLIMYAADRLTGTILLGGGMTFEETFIITYSQLNATARNFEIFLHYAKVG